MNEDSGSKAAVARQATPVGEILIPPSVDGVEPGDRASPHDAITRRIRNPFLEADAGPQPEAAEETATPPLPTSAPPADPDETPLPADPDDSPLNANPFETPSSEISRNIHHIPTPLPGLSSDSPEGAPQPKRHGLIVVAAVIVAGVAVDVFLWKTTGEGPAETAPRAAATDVPASPVEPAGAVVAKPPVPIIAPLPARSHIEISVPAEKAAPVLDGGAGQGNELKLDVPPDQEPHVLEISAPGFAPLKHTVSFAKDLYLAIELQRTAAAKPKKNGRARAAAEPTDEFGSPFVPTTTKRPPTTIDETDPYAP
jgi:hypothetical protein